MFTKKNMNYFARPRIFGILQNRFSCKLYGRLFVMLNRVANYKVFEKTLKRVQGDVLCKYSRHGRVRYAVRQLADSASLSLPHNAQKFWMNSQRDVQKKYINNLHSLKKTLVFVLVFIASSVIAQGQPQTASSLFFKKEKGNYLETVESESGNLFHKLGHHGPAVENSWLAFRIYFDKKTAIDVYSKANPGLELRTKKWYPSKKEQRAGFGADYYKVGKTVGLGGIKLWDGEKVVPLHPVTRRVANVKTTDESSVMELISEGVPYKGEKVTISLKVTVYNERREADVVAECTSGQTVQFVTGINYFKNLQIEKAENYRATWGRHPEDVAADKVEIGAAILFNKNDFEKQLDDGKQLLLVSHPAKKLRYQITSANAREKEINSFDQFLEYVKTLKDSINVSSP